MTRKDDKAKRSRREFLLGMVNRFREPEEKGGHVDSFDTREREADDLAAGGSHVAAQRLYRELLADNPDMSGVRTKLARCLYVSGKVVQARVELTRVVRAGPGATASLYLGLCHARGGGPMALTRAAEAWRDYFNPNEPEIMRAVNVLLARLEAGEKLDPEAAAADIDTVLGIVFPADDA